MMIKVGATSDIGQVREGNEDSFLVLDPLYAVADGMGGHRGGEVASNLALQTIQRLFTAQEGTLTEQVEQANRAVFERSQSDREVAGMGTTLTAALVQGAQVRLAHVGDSRAYLYRDGELQLLTEDHTLVHKMLVEGEITESEAETHPHRSILTRALGVDGNVQVDEGIVEMRNGDRLLLCTDGLTGMVSDEQIKAVLAESKDPQEAVDRLVRAANRAGGIDNITALVIDFVEDGSGDGTKQAAMPHQPTKQQPIPTPVLPPDRTDITVVGRPIPEPPKDRAGAPARASREPVRPPSDRRPPARPRGADGRCGRPASAWACCSPSSSWGWSDCGSTSTRSGSWASRTGGWRSSAAFRRRSRGSTSTPSSSRRRSRADEAQSLALYRELPDGITADDREAAEAIVEQIRRDVEGRLTQPVGS